MKTNAMGMSKSGARVYRISGGYVATSIRTFNPLVTSSGSTPARPHGRVAVAS